MVVQHHASLFISLFSDLLVPCPLIIRFTDMLLNNYNVNEFYERSSLWFALTDAQDNIHHNQCIQNVHIPVPVAVGAPQGGSSQG